MATELSDTVTNEWLISNRMTSRIIFPAKPGMHLLFENIPCDGLKN